MRLLLAILAILTGIGAAGSGEAAQLRLAGADSSCSAEASALPTQVESELGIARIETAFARTAAHPSGDRQPMCTALRAIAPLPVHRADRALE